MSEHDHQVFVFQVLALNEQADPRLKWVYAVPNGGHRHPATAGKLKASGVKRGISDICIPFSPTPKNDDPNRTMFSPKKKGAYVEMKFGKNKLSLEQDEFLRFVAGEGYAIHVAYTCDEALDFIEDYCGIQLRGRR